ncbi:MAG: NAD(P)H-quinone oxidoreductase [Deltaproteobacteria bacterium]|nr:MAG: NAD(P)H-quinone oxidoreductase [Deltaproteobacteria bacterium]
MKAIVITGAGGPDVLAVRDVPTPEPARGEVRVRVRATAVNRADILQRMGLYPAPTDAPQDIPGLEFAGEVDAIGPGVTRWQLGDRVCGLAGGGTYAEFLVAHERALAPIPERASWREAAAIPEAFVTAYDALVLQAHLCAGDTTLIHAAGSGVGTAAIQIARAIGATSVGTSRTPAKLERARDLGLDAGIVPDAGAFADAVREATGGAGPRAVLELVGGAYVAEDVRCVQPGGCIVVVGLMAGARVDLDLGALLRKRVIVRGTVLRSRPVEEKLAAAEALRRHIVPLWARARVRAVIDRTFALDEAPAAHAYVQSNAGFGKVVLDL